MIVLRTRTRSDHVVNWSGKLVNWSGKTIGGSCGGQRPGAKTNGVSDERRTGLATNRFNNEPTNGVSKDERG